LPSKITDPNSAEKPFYPSACTMIDNSKQVDSKRTILSA